MSTSTRTANTVLGYTLTHKLGAGGYGEVWAAEAPGGIAKALKLVYGYHDESRAQSELKALKHIKELRHPFLLSLERIEVADGQLVIVTELADRCIKARFDECVAEGLPGIPRDELLKYLRDAAEALDFMVADHGLQHLDIKPENLLIISGHVKIADFGLVKNLKECTQSLMGGLTPGFSAPELFEGQPARTSDQYSLAIVYQEMLTGQRPFPGTTTAQLAAEHLHGRPNVESLPRGDQSVVLRALSKQPGNRFDSCTEFIESLIVRRGQLQTPHRRPTPSTNSRPGSISNPDMTQFLTAGNLAMVSAEVEAKSMPRIDVDEKAARVHPTLLIGVGKTGSLVIRDVRRKLFQRIGDQDRIPSIRVLCVDSDLDDIAHLSIGEPAEALRTEETFEIPLRAPDEYRRDTGLRFPWLSRRWLFNIPRSRKAEGVRALGRLAFAGHSHELNERLHELVLQVSSAEYLRQTATTIGLPADERPRVIIVAATGGGVGSGIVTDLAFATRAALLQNGLSDENVLGLLAFTGGRSSGDRRLAAANTYALLRELSHFHVTGGFPGDASCELPPFQDDRPAFSQTYYLDWGTDIDEADWNQQVDALSEYIYLDCASAANAFFSKARRTGEQPPSDTMKVHSFSLQQLDVDFRPVVDRLVRTVRRQVLKLWSGDQIDPHRFDGTAFGSAMLARVKLTPNDLIRQVRKMASGTLGKGWQESLLNSITEAVTGHVGRPAEQADRAIACLDELLQAPEARLGISEGSGFHVAMNRQIAQYVKRAIQSLEEEAWRLVDLPGHHLGAANLAFAACIKQMKAMQAELDGSLQKYLHSAESARDTLARAEAWTGSTDPSPVGQYVKLRHTIFLLQWAERFVHELIREWIRVGSQIEELCNGLATLETAPSCQDVQLDAGAHATPQERFADNMAQYLIDKADILAEEVDVTLMESQFDTRGPLSQLLSPEWIGSQVVDQVLTSAVERLSRKALARLDIDQIIHQSGSSEEALTQWIHQCLLKAKHGLIRCGGESRLLMALPAEAQATLLSTLVEKGFGESPSVVFATSGDIVFCLEAKDIQVQQLALRVIEQCPEAAELVTRVMSRNDVEWQTLTGLA